MQVEVPFDFTPAPPKPVPDFRRLQKAFVTAMEAAKKGKQPTVPVPYNFHEAKPGAKLRVHMDSANQNINLTLETRNARINSDLESRDSNVEAHQSTKKHEAQMEKRRK